MAALATERRVFLWRVEARTMPADAAASVQPDGQAVAVTMDDLISILEADWGAGKARIFTKGNRLLDDDDPERDEKSQIYIADIRRVPETETATILINRGDPNAVSPALIDPSANAVRIEHPREGEAPGWSAHLVVSLSSGGAAGRACFEQMTHVSSSLALSALDRMLGRAVVNNPTFRYQVTNRDKKGRLHIAWRPYRPTLSTRRVPSERLSDDLDVGELSGITLTKRATYYQGVGIADLVKRQEEKIVITLRPAEKPKIVDFLRGIVEKAKEENYESISFDITKLPGDATNRPTIPLDDQDALEQLYVRAQRIADFENPLEQCYSTVCNEICGRMRHIIHHGDW